MSLFKYKRSLYVQIFYKYKQQFILSTVCHSATPIIKLLSDAVFADGINYQRQ